ncbi:MAG: RNA polymerase factor sigma-54 [Deltaproteobacteria bacterium]|nr:RNA polymerase factor sigma-54 [Deltaproteobacteria bacterium]
MAMEIRQQLRLSQQLIMTPQLQMAIKLLQLNHLELLDVIQEELTQNAALEEGEPYEDSREAQQNQYDSPEPAESKVSAEGEEVEVAGPSETELDLDTRVADEPDWSQYGEDEDSFGRQAAWEGEDHEAPRYENFIARRESLSDHLLWQAMLRFDDPDSRQAAQAIVGNVNRDGYLESSTEEIARQFGLTQALIERVLAVMQSFDPAGVCARDLGECLLIQLRHLKLSDTVVEKIISGHMANLTNKNYKAIASALKISMEEVGAAVKIITDLEPRPGRAFSDEESHYIVPDIFVYKVGDCYEIVVNDDGLPKLHVSNFYKKALGRNSDLTGEAKTYVKDKLKSAAWLIRSIHQRQRTIYKVVESIVKHQSEFLDHGISCLRPMVLRDVAEDISMHESTISRVTTNKYVHTPQGIFELKYFFNSSISTSDGGTVASASVKEKIQRLVKDEDSKKPLSDDRIMQLLEKDDIQIARRTVAKYREMLGILPSGKRRSIN